MRSACMLAPGQSGNGKQAAKRILALSRRSIVPSASSPLLLRGCCPSFPQMSRRLLVKKSKIFVFNFHNANDCFPRLMSVQMQVAG